MPRPLHIILPDSGADLLRQELHIAFLAEGHKVTRARPEALANPGHADFLPRLLGNGPSLLVCINGQGLGNCKVTLDTLQKAGGAALIWCVDNPWNILAGVRDPLWKTLPFFVTDASFLPALERHGAFMAAHLPLGACPACFAPLPARDARFPAPTDLAPFVFVGRSRFPGKAGFFAGLQPPRDLWAEAWAMIAEGGRPDLTWWEERLGTADMPLWPGKNARLPALCAEESSLLWRGRLLAAAAEAGGAFIPEHKDAATGTARAAGLDVFGDSGWHGFLPAGSRLRLPVDYYARLPGIYSAARFNIALTSLQLPAGLNQRHFDVWMAGSVCLSDATPGLDLFPGELTEPVTFTDAASLREKAGALEASPEQRHRLIGAWQAHILAHHTYQHRVRALLAHLDQWGVLPR